LEKKTAPNETFINKRPMIMKIFYNPAAAQKQNFNP